MSKNKPIPDEQPMDPATIVADDLFLDALVGGDVAEGDELTTMLATWRAEVGTDVPSMGNAELIQAVIASDREARPFGTTPRSRARRRPLRAAALVAAGLAVGLAIGGNHATPTSPLWPITKIMYPQQAEVRTVEYAIQRARAADAAGRYDEARRLVDEAGDHIGRIDTPAVAAGLRADLDTVLRNLPSAKPTATPRPTATPTSADKSTPRATVPAPGPGPDRTEDSGTTGASHGPQEPGLRLPIVPESPVPLVPSLLPLPKPSVLLR